MKRVKNVLLRKNSISIVKLLYEKNSVLIVFYSKNLKSIQLATECINYFLDHLLWAKFLVLFSSQI